MTLMHRLEITLGAAGAAPWIALIATLSGVLLSSIIPIGKSLIDRRLQNKEYNKRAAVFFSHKLMFMLSSSHIINQHFTEGITRADKANTHPGLFTQPMNRICDEVNFTEENIWAVIKLCKSAGMNAFGFLDAQFNVMVRSVDYYTKIKQELEAIMPAPKVDKGGVAYEIDVTNQGVIVLRMKELDKLVMTLVDHSQKNKEAIINALRILLESKDFPYPEMELTFDTAMGNIPVIKAYSGPWRKLRRKLKKIARNFFSSLILRWFLKRKPAGGQAL
ncbi:MAG: hypothetical protein ACRYFY_09170 [Janthinobacterium lividum]